MAVLLSRLCRLWSHHATAGLISSGKKRCEAALVFLSRRLLRRLRASVKVPLTSHISVSVTIPRDPDARFSDSNSGPTVAASCGHFFTLPAASHRRSEVNRLERLKVIVKGIKASFPWQEKKRKKNICFLLKAGYLVHV